MSKLVGYDMGNKESGGKEGSRVEVDDAQQQANRSLAAVMMEHSKGGRANEQDRGIVISEERGNKAGPAGAGAGTFGRREANEDSAKFDNNNNNNNTSHHPSNDNKHTSNSSTLSSPEQSTDGCGLMEFMDEESLAALHHQDGTAKGADSREGSEGRKVGLKKVLQVLMEKKKKKERDLVQR
tara:strand:- start:325 stop:870 length:546 start_codon:yes stop_codon:yes gene_type:complete